MMATTFDIARSSLRAVPTTTVSLDDERQHAFQTGWPALSVCDDWVENFETNAA